jgi:hypothetical protein
MKTAIYLLLGHVLVISLLFYVGINSNDWLRSSLDEYQGLTTVFSLAFGIYATAGQWLYHRSARVHMFVNRVYMQFRSTHTFWLPMFVFEITEMPIEERDEMLAGLAKAFHELPFKRIKSTFVSRFETSIDLDQKLVFRTKISDSCLIVTLDRKTMVPSHLYEQYRKLFAKIAEMCQQVVGTHLNATRLGMQITFDDGIVNPYYGFLIRQLPSQVVRRFDVSFQFGNILPCRIDAANDEINIEGHSSLSFFDAIAQVVNLQPVTRENSA